MREITVSITELRCRFYGILDAVAEGRLVVVVTKRGKPLAKIVPIDSVLPPLKGRWKGKAKTTGGIVNFDTSDEWEVLR